MLLFSGKVVRMAEATTPLAAAQREFLPYTGPDPGVQYPVRVKYCGGISYVPFNKQIYK